MLTLALRLRHEFGRPPPLQEEMARKRAHGGRAGTARSARRMLAGWPRSASIPARRGLAYHTRSLCRVPPGYVTGRQLGDANLADDLFDPIRDAGQAFWAERRGNLTAAWPRRIDMGGWSRRDRTAGGGFLPRVRRVRCEPLQRCLNRPRLSPVPVCTSSRGRRARRCERSPKRPSTTDATDQVPPETNSRQLISGLWNETGWGFGVVGIENGIRHCGRYGGWREGRGPTLRRPDGDHRGSC